MLDLNNNITNIQQIDLLSSGVVTKETVKPVEKKDNIPDDDAVKLNISHQALNQVSEILSKDETLAQKIFKSQAIVDSLSDARTKIRDLLQILNDPEMSFDDETLNQMDIMSNSLIDSVIKSVKNNDDMNIIDSNLINIYMDGLKSIKNLDLTDTNFLTKIQAIENNIKLQEVEYSKATGALYSDYVKVQNVDDSGKKSKEISENIVKKANETLASVTANISPEAVVRLLKG